MRVVTILIGCCWIKSWAHCGFTWKVPHHQAGTICGTFVELKSGRFTFCNKNAVFSAFCDKNVIFDKRVFLAFCDKKHFLFFCDKNV